jgi:hypothetical protein
MYDNDIKVNPFTFLGVVAALLLAVFLLRGIYTQDAGEVVVLRNWGGSINPYAAYCEHCGRKLVDG